MQTRRDIINWIQELEKKYPVEKWVLGGIAIWPLVKKELYFQLVKLVDKVYVSASSGTSPRNGIAKALLLFKSLLAVVTLIIKPRRARTVFSGMAAHRVAFRDTSYNRYFDPMMDYLEERGESALLIEYFGKRDKKQNYYKQHRILFITDYIPFFRFLYRIFKVKPVRAVEGYDDFLRDIAGCQLLAQRTQKFELQALERQLDMIQSYAKAFEFLFKQFKTRLAFGLCYYNNEMFAMNCAAVRAGTISVDMQHGTQGPLHFAYTSWSKIPTNGYNLLPNVFWCWDEISALTIRKWLINRPECSVLIGGNPWISLLQHHRHKFPLPENLVLYTLQPVGKLLDPYIIESIKLTKGHYNWWIRLHPRQLDKKSELEALLTAEGLLHHVNIHEAFLLPLPHLLRNAFVHISKFSGSIQESIILGTPTLIIHPIGVETFMQYVESNAAMACLSENSADLVKSITRAVGLRNENGILNLTFEPCLDELMERIENNQFKR